MKVRFEVEKVAELKHRAFDPDPMDPQNTIDTGKNIQEVTLSVIPTERGGRGTLVLQLNGGIDIGTFQAGDKVTVELTVER